LNNNVQYSAVLQLVGQHVDGGRGGTLTYTERRVRKPNDRGTDERRGVGGRGRPSLFHCFYGLERAQPSRGYHSSQRWAGEVNAKGPPASAWPPPSAVGGRINGGGDVLVGQLGPPSRRELLDTYID